MVASGYPVAIHGFNVIAVGRVSAAFERALRRLAEKGYVDPACTVIKTANGRFSGITHAGGRYIHALNTRAASVMAEMRKQGIKPPPLPFLVAPGATTLFHEWGHHVDRLWSPGDEVLFSFRWFSRFYRIQLRPMAGLEDRPGGPAQRDGVLMPDDAAKAAWEWHDKTSELFASLFEEWMGQKPALSDCCSPADFNHPWLTGRDHVLLELQPGADAGEVRAKTYELFERGQDQPMELAPVREDLFAEHTAWTLSGFRAAMKQLRGEA